MTISTPAESKLKVTLAFGAIYLVWGSTFYAVKIALLSFPPFLLSGLRLLLAGTTLLLYCVIIKEKLPTVQDLLKNVAAGLVIFMGGIVAVVWAQQYIASSLASIIITTPFWFVVLDKRQWGFYFSSKWILTGLGAGLIGVILLLGFKQGRPGSEDERMQIISILTMIGGSFLWVMGSLFLKYRPTQSSTYVNTSVQLIPAGLLCLVISYFSNEFASFSFERIRADSVAAILYLSWISSMLTFMAFIWLIKVRPPAIVSTYSYVNPVVAVLLGWGLGGEIISPLQLVALAIILCGVLMVNIPKYRN